MDIDKSRLNLGRSCFEQVYEITNTIVSSVSFHVMNIMQNKYKYLAMNPVVLHPNHLNRRVLTTTTVKIITQLFSKYHPTIQQLLYYPNSPCLPAPTDPFTGLMRPQHVLARMVFVAHLLTMVWATTLMIDIDPITAPTVSYI